MQQWLRHAWQQPADTSLTAFARRELRNQMKQCSADLQKNCSEWQSNSGSRLRCWSRTITSLIREFWPVTQRSGADRGPRLGSQPRTQRRRHGAAGTEQHHIRAMDETHPGRADQLAGN